MGWTGDEARSRTWSIYYLARSCRAKRWFWSVFVVLEICWRTLNWECHHSDCNSGSLWFLKLLIYLPASFSMYVRTDTGVVTQNIELYKEKSLRGCEWWGWLWRTESTISQPGRLLGNYASTRRSRSYGSVWGPLCHRDNYPEGLHVKPDVAILEL